MNAATDPFSKGTGAKSKGKDELKEEPQSYNCLEHVILAGDAHQMLWLFRGQECGTPIANEEDTATATAPAREVGTSHPQFPEGQIPNFDGKGSGSGGSEWKGRWKDKFKMPSVDEQGLTTVGRQAD